LHFFFVP
jgi:hypothetical protein